VTGAGRRSWPSPSPLDLQALIATLAPPMKKTLIALLLCSLTVSPALAADDYPPGPDSKKQPGVPEGEVLKFTFDKSKIFPGTTREYWVYVPRQYDPARPACVYVNQDNVQWCSTI
jgi:hypothetical protein